jgi:hypothetical protein
LNSTNGINPISRYNGVITHKKLFILRAMYLRLGRKIDLHMKNSIERKRRKNPRNKATQPASEPEFNEK